MVVVRLEPETPAPLTVTVMPTEAAEKGCDVAHVRVVELPPVVMAPSVTVRLSMYEPGLLRLMLVLLQRRAWTDRAFLRMNVRLVVSTFAVPLVGLFIH